MADEVVIPNNYGIATMRWTLIPAGKLFTVTCGYRDVNGSNDPQLPANIYRTAMVKVGGPAEASTMTTQWRFEGVSTLQRLSTGVLQAGADLTPTTGTGTTSPDLVPVYSPLIVSKRTAFAGRQYRGRMYPPFTSLLEAQVDLNGGIAGATVAALQTRWTVFASDGGLVSFPPYLLHTIPQSGVSIFPTAITGFTVRSVVGIQRRRRAKGA